MSKISEKTYSDYVALLPGNKGLAIAEDTPFAMYEEAVRAYGAIVADGLWALGDLFIFGERKYGERFSQTLDSLKYSEKTLKNATWVCSEFPPSRRHKLLSFNHHQAVASLNPEEREAILVEAESQELSVRDLTALKKSRHPSTRKPSKKKAEADQKVPESSAEAPTVPAKEEAHKITLPEALTLLDQVVSFFEQQDPKIKFTPEYAEDMKKRLNGVRKQARRYGFLGGN